MTLFKIIKSLKWHLNDIKIIVMSVVKRISQGQVCPVALQAEKT